MSLSRQYKVRLTILIEAFGPKPSPDSTCTLAAMTKWRKHQHQRLSTDCTSPKNSITIRHRVSSLQLARYCRRAEASVKGLGLPFQQRSTMQSSTSCPSEHTDSCHWASCRKANHHIGCSIRSSLSVTDLEEAQPTYKITWIART